jgi:dolichol-phosphate mannosyltransferase
MLSIVIPCYNEADNASQVAHGLFPVAASLGERMPVEIIFVNDGSKDGTKEAFEALCRKEIHPRVSARVLNHERNKGLGAALRTGFGAAKGDVIISTDSDATYRFEEIPALLAVMTDDVDVVTASPYHPLGGVANVPQYRLVLSKGSSFLYRRIIGKHVHTYTALFRAYRRRVLETAPFSSNGFLAGTEILVNAMLAGYKVAEYPTVLHSRVIGTSKAKLLRTIRAHLTFQGRILLKQVGLNREGWVAETPSIASPAMKPLPVAAPKPRAMAMAAGPVAGRPMTMKQGGR